ncbi:MAG: hypothetical protein GTO03_09055, partial [Planctomycetales bacterium]|nr:hypothetical protein [Planctomycetales bacterium]
TVIVATGREGEGRAGRRGRVLEFRGTGLVLHTAPGRKVTIPAERVIGIETERTTPHQEGDACWEEGRYQQAARHYEAALEGQREPRAWVRQQISAALIRCRHAAGEHHA